MTDEVEGVDWMEMFQPLDYEINSATCPVLMGGTGVVRCVIVRCGRPIHDAPKGVDDTPVCLMHSKDEAKQAGSLLKQFELEVKTILKTAGDGVANFGGFVFPEVRFVLVLIRANCEFQFRGATFIGFADFSNVHFARTAAFESATFCGEVRFSQSQFSENADFSLASFEGRTSFLMTQFIGDANFGSATFNEEADFIGTTFKKKATFFSVSFLEFVDFEVAHFLGNSDLRRLNFRKGASFRRTEFNPQKVGEASPDFTLANFEEPRTIVFDDVDLSQALFLNCDVSEVWFTSSVRWGKRSNNRGVAIFEETVSLDDPYRPLRDGKRDYRAIAQIYQHLKKNYDLRLDYWTANEFHFAEMEMRRLAAPTETHTGLRRVLRGLGRTSLGLAAWYRYASDYGNSYVKPLLWMVAILLFFSTLFPLAGLQRTGTSFVETYSSVWTAASSAKQGALWEVGLWSKSLLMAVDTASFQKGAEYGPAYPWGRVLAIVETLLTSTLFALFLLAIRRQFRR